MAPRHEFIDFFEGCFNLGQRFSPTGNMDFLRSDGSGVNREISSPFCEGLRGKLPWSTHPRKGQATVLVALEIRVSLVFSQNVR